MITWDAEYQECEKGNICSCVLCVAFLYCMKNNSEYVWTFTKITKALNVPLNPSHCSSYIPLGSAYYLFNIKNAETAILYVMRMTQSFSVQCYLWKHFWTVLFLKCDSSLNCIWILANFSVDTLTHPFLAFIWIKIYNGWITGTCTFSRA